MEGLPGSSMSVGIQSAEELSECRDSMSADIQEALAAGGQHRKNTESCNTSINDPPPASPSNAQSIARFRESFYAQHSPPGSPIAKVLTEAPPAGWQRTVYDSSLEGKKVLTQLQAHRSSLDARIAQLIVRSTQL